eukprot:425662-Pelagomonas_calceolata.AAC.2
MEHEKFTLYPFLCPEHFSSLARVTVNLPQAATATAAGTDVVHRFEHEAQDQVEDKGDGDIEQRDACRRLQAAVLGGSCVCFFSPGKPRTVQVACHKVRLLVFPSHKNLPTGADSWAMLGYAIQTLKICRKAE